MGNTLGRVWLTLLSVAGLVLVVACNDETPAPNAVATETPAGLIPLVTAAGAANEDLAPLPTLFPTVTGAAAPEVQPTREDVAPGPTNTPIDFQQVVVSLTYAIPGLGLERSLQGTISSQITIIDEATGARLSKQNQATVLLDVQQVLENIELEPYPEDCSGCVRLDYSLPLSDREGSGWLQNETILASLENYFAANLGPHFPADTVVGLRRSASPFDSAHTLAVTQSGRLWLWTAIDAEISIPAEDDAAGSGLLAAANEIDVEQLATSYRADCPGNALETVFIGVSSPILIALQCPELALPTTLTEFYQELQLAVEPILSGEIIAGELQRYLPLDAYLYYERPDASLVLYADGGAVVEPAGITIRNSDPPSQTLQLTGTFTATSAISLTQGLRDLNLLRGPLTQEITGRSLVTDTEAIDPHLLILRDEVAVWAATWIEPPNSLALFTEQLDSLIDRLLLVLAPEPTLVPEETGTPEAVPTDATPTPTATNGPTPTLTPTPNE